MAIRRATATARVSRMALLASLATLVPHASGRADAQVPGRDEAAVAPPAPARMAEAETGAAEGTGQAGDIVVTGSRLATSFSAPTPVAVVGAERLEARGSSNIADALNEVPAFRATNTPAGAEQLPNAGYVGGRILDLRGLGSVRTLTLVDGKRFVPSTTQATVDTNMIPSILLNRAEVVTGGASAQYGSDAVSGVVNLILNRNMAGVKVSAQQAITGLGDNSDTTIGMAGGAALTSTLHVFVGAEYQNNRGIGDCRARDFCRTETLNFGRNPRQTGVPANSILANVRPSTVPYNGVTTPPSSAYVGRTSPTLRPIDGITFGADGTPRRFVYGSPVNSFYMIGGEGAGENIYFTDFFFVAPTERYAVTGGADWQVTPDVKASLSINYGHLKGEYSSLYYKNPALVIKADNPFIPRSIDPTLDIPTLLAAGGLTSFTLGKGYQEIGRTPIVSRNEVFRGVAALSGAFSSRWSWDAYYEFGRNEFRSDTTNAIVSSRLTNALDAARNAQGQIVCRINADAVASNDDPRCAPFNPFGRQASQAAKDYVTANAFQTNVTTEQVAAANLRGSLLDLPAGAVAMAVGGEFRSDKVAGDADPLSQSLAFYAGNASRIAGKIDVTEGYVEVEVPVLAEMAFARELSLNGAARRTHYHRSGLSGSSNVDVTTYKYGVVWEPIEAVRFRATRSRDIRAPNVGELFGPVTMSEGVVTDPVKGQTVVTIRGGSNPALVPERANTFTAGMVLKPTGGFLGRFRGSADYYNIRISDAISTLGQQNILTRCFQGNAASCSLIVRNADGFAISVNDTQQNVNKLITRGIDFELNYRQPLGAIARLDARLFANYVMDLITVDAVGPINRVGQTGLRGGTPAGLPDWTLDGLISLNYRAFTFNAHARYINKGFYNAAFIGPDEASYDIALTNSVNSNKVPSRTYLDLLVQYDLGFGNANSLMLYAGVDNIFNTKPPLSPGSHGTGNSILFNPALRTFKVGTRVKF